MRSVERLREASTRQALGETGPALLGEYGALIGGKQIKSGPAVAVHSPYDDALVAIVYRAGPAQIEQAIQGAHTSFYATTRKLPAWQRAQILEKVSAAINARREQFARAIALEAGKPIRLARGEADRAAFTFKVAAEESKRIYGEVIPLDWIPGLEARTGQVRRVPLGPIVGITPFNYPLNLVAHKVAPAMAAGDSIILRPASQTPVSSFLLAEALLESGWPEDAISVVPSATADAAPLVSDERIKLLTFTGSPAVGWGLKARAGAKRVTLELGGNAGVIVHKDADLPFAAERVTWGGFQYSGQSCISAQRIYVHAEVYDAFVEDLLRRVNALVVGDPLEEATDVGPLIDHGAVERVAAWVEEAVAGGAQVLVGGHFHDNFYAPSVLSGIREEMSVSCKEVFGPLVGLYRYHDALDAIHAVGASDFGLQAGLFTNDLRIVQTAFEEIEVGGLMINEVPTFRIDHMPYGGVKNSGIGREGLRYAIEEMSEMKLLTINPRR